MAGDQQAVIDFLADPRTHGDRPVQRRQTHGAHIFLVGDRAYKLKRAVAFPYMDFSTVDKRRAAVEAEVALNRRTAPELYRRARAIGERDGHLAFDATPARDWVVEMARFDDDDLLSEWAERGKLNGATLDGLIAAVCAFHRRQPPHPSADGWPDHFRWVVAENLEELTARADLFDADQVTALADRTRAALAGIDGLLQRRAEAGFVRHLHGDLHLRNVAMIDGRPVIFDCLEFDPVLARIDVLYDLAFLVMDLMARGMPDLAARALTRYLADGTGLDGVAQMPLFLSARGAIRAKVSASAADAAPDGDARQREVATARAYLRLALDCLAPQPARLVAIAGLSGTGKTSVARRLAADLGRAPGAILVRSDVIRKQLAGAAETDRLPDSAYAPAMTQRVFAEVNRRCSALLAAGHGVIADAVYARPNERAALADLAMGHGARFDGVWLEASEATRAARVSGRSGDASDADAAIVRRQSGYDTGPMGWRTVSAEGDIATVEAAVRAALELSARAAG